MAQNYTLGRGEVHFSRFKPGTRVLEGFRYIGNTPEFNLTIENENLDHYSSDRGIREKDDSVPLEVNRSGTMITDNINPDNVALFFFGETSVVSTAGATITAEEHDDVKQGLSYQLGISPSNPAGVAGIVVPGTGPTLFAVTDDAGVPVSFVEGADYTIEADTGLLFIVEGGDIVDGTNIRVSYTTQASSRKQVISGSRPVEGAIKYIARNPKGENFDYYLPYVTISPNGDYALKGDEWQQIPFNIEVLKLDNQEAIYVNGRPFTA